MDMLKEESNIGADLKKIAMDILDVANETIGLIANPSTLWLAVLLNCNGGSGFNGFITNPSKGNLDLEIMLTKPIEKGSYKGFTIYYNNDLKVWSGIKYNGQPILTDMYYSEQRVYDWIDAHGY